MAELQQLADQVAMLAETIGKKNQELETLKRAYTAKIQYLERIERVYVDAVLQVQQRPLSPNGGTERRLQGTCHEEKSIQEEIKSTFLNEKAGQLLGAAPGQLDVKCSNCGHLVYDSKDNSQNENFILFPKLKLENVSASQIHLPQATELKVQYEDTQKTQGNDRGNRKISAQSEGHSRKSKKKTCSYCNQKGHSRARCFERLLKEKQ